MPGVVGGMTVDELTSKSGIAGGLCVFPRATPDDAKLALALAQRPTFIVHVMAKDADQAAKIRADAAAAGVLGRKLYVEQGNATSLPFANRLVDLMVISDLHDTDLTAATRSEWLRVLAPGRGVALLGCTKETVSGLSTDKLKSWSQTLPLAKVQEDDSGTWVWLRANLPAGSDAWTHYLHGPERSQTSMDTALQAPFLTQWWGEPRQEGYWGTVTVACNGRMFTVRSNRIPQYNNAGYALLTARSMNNGVILWQKELRSYNTADRDGGFVSGRSCAVATGDSLFILDRDGVLRLDAETGAERARIMGPKPSGQVKWIAIEGNLLAVMAGDPDSVLKPDDFKDLPESVNKRVKVNTLAHHVVTSVPVGRDLAVYDIETGKPLWHDTVAGDIFEELIALRDQRLYYPQEGVGMVCRDLDTGHVVWTNKDPDLQASFNPTHRVLGRLDLGPAILAAYKDVLVLRASMLHMALSIQNGDLLWKIPLPNYIGNHSCVWGDTLLSDKRAFDLMTGKETTGPVLIKSGCGVTTSTPNYLITCFGRVSDAKSNQLIRLEDVKGPCEIGTIVSEGMMITVPSECACNFEIKGYRALVSAGDIKLHTAPPWKGRLADLDPAEPQPLQIAPEDWPTYRHDPQRSAGSAAIVGEQPKKILWQWKPSGMEPYSKPYAFEGGLKPDFLATAPVAADGLVWFGSADGTIRCVKADTGAEVWSFATKGMLFKPPTLWQGRLLAGGGDGCIYCLDARTGKCLWRFQAAPLDRRVFWYGHLINTWPILTGVVVQNDIAYAVAGYQKGNGVYAYALDPRNGQVIWERDDIGSCPDVIMHQGNNSVAPFGVYNPYGGHVVAHYHQNEDEYAGLDSHGSIAAGDNKLWLPGGYLDLKTGAEKSFGQKYGCEVGILDNFVFRGGRRISETEDTLLRPLGSSDITACTLSNSEDEVCTEIPLNRFGTSLPAWDAEDILLPSEMDIGGSLFLMPRAQFTTMMTGDLVSSAPPTNEPADTSANSALPSLQLADAKPKPKWPDLKQWAVGNFTNHGVAAAFALAKDQAVVALSDGSHHRLIGYLRAGGKQAWTIDLPEQPAMNRLALDREGHVLVSLCDGSVVCVGQ
jgi:outer membrane protein assembly factor BamB